MTLHASFLSQQRKLGSKLAFRSKVFLLLFGLLILQVIVMVWHFDSTLYESLKHQVGTRALIQAKEIASDPNLLSQVKAKDTQAIKPLIERLAKISDASFIVIGDEKGIRLFHPIPESIGHPMQGDDNIGVLEHGESYVTLRKGSLGYGVRGKTPIFDEHKNIIGVVSVGYLLNRFDQWLAIYMKPLLIDIFVIIILATFMAWWFSRHIQKQMNDMEPQEISLALNLQKSILSSVYEGVIAIDRNGYFLTMNKSAQKLLDIQLDITSLKQHNITELTANTAFFFREPQEQNLQDEMFQLRNNSFIANRVPIFTQQPFSPQQQLIGWVISFRKKDEIHSLTSDLTQVKQYTDNFRVLRHEFSNRLATISGLIQMGQFDEVQQLIAQENNSKQQLIDFIQAQIRLPQVAGLLLGKALRAKELGLNLQLDPTCQLHALPPRLTETELCAILGNLIDNAFESTQRNPTSNKIIHVFITDAGQDWVIEVTDNGTGIDPQTIPNLWQKGFTSKTDKVNHGIGLYLVHHYVTHANGFIHVDTLNSEYESVHETAQTTGCIFSIFIPKANTLTDKAT
ncbi:MAG: ATP-binding protein [Vibrio sp.]